MSSRLSTIKLEFINGREILVFITDMEQKQFNNFRRIILSEIAIVAVDLVQIVHNDSQLADEILANRLGLAPVMLANNDSFIRKDLCKCQLFCDKCALIIDFSRDKSSEKYMLKTDDISPLLMNDISILSVFPGQKMSFRLLCTKSLSEEHFKWSPGVVLKVEKLLTKNGKNLGHSRVTLHNTGPLEFSDILHQALAIMKSKFGVTVRII